MEPLLNFQTQHSTNSEFENSEVEDSFHLDSDENKSEDDEIDSKWTTRSESDDDGKLLLRVFFKKKL